MHIPIMLIDLVILSPKNNNNNKKILFIVIVRIISYKTGCISIFQGFTINSI